ncbi:kinase-like domain-containing protein [Rhizophagus clarus]|uniref:Kinase-like domain-containing protein n=1 Tax=Rhizophagus clarus TaxID=94130 RepID=A0A8H3MJ24_9GLOM|nr:kinase-like domain-containing protein [Rhizophagus clarus]
MSHIITLEDEYCEKCGEQYIDSSYKWCKTCQINELKNSNITNWTSENENIDNLIQEMQLKIKSKDDIVFEWIPYNQFDDIKEIETDKDGFVRLCSAVWKNGPLLYCENECGYKRSCQNKRVTLKCLHNSQNVFNEVKAYSINRDEYFMVYEIYGISQAPNTENYILILQCVYCEICGKRYTNIYDESSNWCKSCQIDDLKNNFVNWTSGNEEIDNLIQEMQLKIDTSDDKIFEWIPYNQLNDIKEINKIDNSDTIYSAFWKEGPLHWDEEERYIRHRNKNVALKYLRDVPSEFLNEVKIKVYLYSITRTDELLYGISQDPNTKNYIMIFANTYCKKCGEKLTNLVYDWCKSCQIYDLRNKFTQWTSGHEIIDNLIQEMQLRVETCHDIIFEWIPYNQFNDIKEIDRDDFGVVYSAIWKDGHLQCNKYETYKRRQQNEAVILKLYNSKNITNDFLNKVKSYSIKEIHSDKQQIYGITQHPDLKDFIIVLEYIQCEKCCKQLYDGWCKPCQLGELTDNFTNWTSGNEKIDNLVQYMQLNINSAEDVVFEWIPYDQFVDIKKIGRGGFAEVYSAIWIDGPFHHAYDEYSRNKPKEVALKCLYNSKNISDQFLNEIKAYSIKEYNSTDNILPVHGITQNPDTKDYIMVLDYARGGDFCNWINENYNRLNWLYIIRILSFIIGGLKIIHDDKDMVHHMGLCGPVGNTAKTEIYGVTPYIAPEVLRGEPYTKAADIYSFGMIMYFVATGKQPFSNCAHDQGLVLDICKGDRPRINESEAPKCYTDMMKKCWDSKPNNRPNAAEIEELINLFYYSYSYDESEFKKVMNIEKEEQHYKIKRQFKASEESRKTFISSYEENENENRRSTTHPEAIYTSRIINTLTKEQIDECLDCKI